MISKKDIFSLISNVWIGFAFLSWISIEVLSLCNEWTRTFVLLFWTIVIIVVLFCQVYRFAHCDKREGINLKDIGRGYWVNKYRAHPYEYSILIVFYIIIFIFALLRKQSNYDSFVYHLSRIMHWIQNKSVGFYAAGDFRQNTYPRLSEYMLAQLLIIKNSNRLANTLSMLSYVFSGIMIYGIGQKLGVKQIVSFCTMFLYYFMPMAMGQCFAAQTDNVACLFLLIFVFLILDYIKSGLVGYDVSTILKTIRLAICTTLCYLCKPTTSFAILVFAIWMLVVLMKKRQIKGILINLIIAVIIAGLMLIPNLYRSYQYKVDYQKYLDGLVINQQFYQEDSDCSEQDIITDNADVIITPDIVTQTTNAPDVNTLTALTRPTLFFSYALRNITRNSFSFYFSGANNVIASVVNRVADNIGIDNYMRFAAQNGKEFWDYDTASAPALMFLSLIMFVLVIVCGKKRLDYIQMRFSMICVIAFVFQCGCMGYTGGRTRYLIGIEAILCVSIGIAISEIVISERERKIALVLALAICIPGAVHSFMLQADKAIRGTRAEGTTAYFYDYEPNEQLYGPVIRQINKAGFTKVAIAGVDGHEYVFWDAIKDLERLECVNLNDAFSIYEDYSYIPQCIVKSWWSEETDGYTMMCHGHEYQWRFASEEDGVYCAVYIEKE